MPISTVQRFPYSRTLLPRTRLAYIHLRNLLTDAKRDRGARIAGYVAIWLPEEMIVLYMIEGELVNATMCDSRGSRAVSIAHALEKVPPEPEYGELCFCAAEPEQLDCMYLAQTAAPVAWPEKLAVSDPVTLFPYLGATTFDGLIEITCGDTVNYVVFVNGRGVARRPARLLRLEPLALGQAPLGDARQDWKEAARFQAGRG